MSLVRILEITPSSGNFHFAGPERQTWLEVDWFRDDNPEAPQFGTPEGQAAITEFIKAKRYFKPGRAYLVLHPEHSFTIGYSAP